MSTPSGNLTISTVTLIHHPSGPILVDCGAWNQRHALSANLKRLGILSSDITMVIFTHLHWDHCMNFELFASAQLLVSRREWERVARGELDHATPFFVREAMERRGRVECVEGGELIAGVTVLPTPGHTEGHIAVSVESGRRVVIAGDALPTRHAAETGLPHLYFGPEAQARHSVSAILRAADVVIPGHDAPFETGTAIPATLSLLNAQARSQV